MLDNGAVERRLQSADGTRRYAIKVSADLRAVEAVFIPEEGRGTLCVSSQVGCSLSCSFCHTGTQRLEANLSSGAILKQLVALPRAIQEMVTNVVFMGQGEPLYNLRGVSKAIEIMTDPEGLAIAHGRVTVSTSGVAPAIPRVASEMGVNLAVSLHAPNDLLRSHIMAINKTYPLALLMEACTDFARLASCATRRISFEYVMLRDVNDSIGVARELVRLLRHLPCHVNLIPFNAWPGAPYECSPAATIEAFKEELTSSGLPTTVRRARGADIMAACGQLAGKGAVLKRGLDGAAPKGELAQSSVDQMVRIGGGELDDAGCATAQSRV